MIKGINEKEECIIQGILKDYPYDFFYYGSRVKGNYTKLSDLDILLKNETEVPYSVIEDIELKFNESKIPYIVNILQYANMDENFYNLIKNDLVKIEN